MKRYKKTTINFPIELYEKIKKESERIGVSFSTMVRLQLFKATIKGVKK